MVVVTRRVPMTRGAALRSRVKGNFQARFWNSGGRGDSPADCSKLSDRLLVADERKIKMSGDKRAEYDAIAQEYRDSKQLPFRSYVEEYTLFGLLGSLAGLAVLDLA